MAFRGSIGVVLIALALIVSGQRASNNVKVGGESSVKIPKSINHEGTKHAQNLIQQSDQLVDHGMQKRIDSIEEIFDFNETDFHSESVKPSKFDRDISGLIHTDLKSMHESEAARLKVELEESNLAAKNGSVVESTISNSTRRMDDEETVTEEESADHRDQSCNGKVSMVCLERGLGHLVEKMSNIDVYNITDYAQIVRNSRSVDSDVSARDDSVIDKLARYVKEHALNIRMPSDQPIARGARFFFSAIFQDKKAFLTGLGLGFLAFGLKNLMLPIVIGMKIINSVLIALFLPSILGGIGRILGKGVSSFSQVSQGATNQPEESFDFKDNADIYNDDYMRNQPIGTLPASAMYNSQEYLNNGNQMSGTTGTNQRISYVNTLSDNYYSRNSMQGAQGATKRQDYKVFHEIPTSSLLLTNYDPFYSPLLSRLDAVFSRLGHSTEPCREYAICAMYRSPARYAPYSNLVSAQLSRELNELRKPSSDNPDVLRFFKYMKAAKDGQDGVQCEDIYTECASRGNASGQNQAMLATYQDINKLVQARKM